MYNHFHPYVVHGDQIVYSKATPAQPPAYEQTIRGPPEVIEIEDPSFYEGEMALRYKVICVASGSALTCESSGSVASQDGMSFHYYMISSGMGKR